MMRQLSKFGTRSAGAHASQCAEAQIDVDAISGRYYSVEFELLEVSGKTVMGTTYLQVRHFSVRGIYMVSGY